MRSRIRSRAPRIVFRRRKARVSASCSRRWQQPVSCSRSGCPTLRTALHRRWPRRHCWRPSARLTTSDRSRSRLVCCCRPRPSPSCFCLFLQMRDVASFLPFWAERATLFLAGLWFVNLVNFMDGIDWITVAEVVPVTASTRRSSDLPDSSHPGRRSSRRRSAAPTLALLRSTAPWQRFSWATSAACRRACCWRGVCSISAAHGQLVAALLLPLYYLMRRDLDLAAKALARREGLAGPPQPFLPAGNRQWLFGFAGGRACVRAQRRPRDAGGTCGGDDLDASADCSTCGGFGRCMPSC